MLVSMCSSILTLKGTIHYDMKYSRDGELLRHEFVDSNWARDTGTHKSTSRYCSAWDQV
jgi:hypothetical protein